MSDEKDIFASLSGLGDGRLVPFSDTEQAMVKDWIPTLMPEVDKALNGGIPLSGKVSQMFGDAGVGKSTFVMNLLAIAQRMGIIPIYFDVEGTTDRTRLMQLGVNPNAILTKVPYRDKKTNEITPLTIEEIMSDMATISATVNAQDPTRQSLFIWDTVGMTQSSAVADTDYGTQRVGTQAKALSEGIRKLNANLVANNGSVIALNQKRDDFSAAIPNYSSPKTVGGNAWNHEMSLSIYLGRGKKITPNSTDKTEIGHEVRIQLKKTKVDSTTGLTVSAYFLQDNGFDLEYNLFEEADKIGIITGTQFKSYIDGTGKEIKKRKNDFIEFLKTEEGRPVYNEIFQKLIKHYFPQCYPALFNVNVPLTPDKFPEVEGLKEYYMDIQEKLDPQDQHTMYKTWKENQSKSKKKSKAK